MYGIRVFVHGMLIFANLLCFSPFQTKPVLFVRFCCFSFKQADKKPRGEEAEAAVKPAVLLFAQN